MQGVVPRGGDEWDFMHLFANRVEQASGGRIKITPFGGGEIMPEIETFGAVSKGALKINYTDGGYWVDKTNNVSGFCATYPFTLLNATQYRAFMQETGVEELIRDAYAKHNVYWLGMAAIAEADLLTKWPVNEIDDLKGHKIRALSTFAVVFAKAGLTATYFPRAEVYGALERGVIDGVIYGGLVGEYEGGFHEVTNYIVRPAVGLTGGELDFNLDTWNELPEDLKAILKAAWGEAVGFYDARSLYHAAVIEEEMVKDWGLERSYMSEEMVNALRKYSLEVLDEYSQEDAVFADIAARLKTFMQMLGLI